MFILIISMQLSHIAISEKEESMESELLLIGECMSGRSEGGLKAKVLQGLSSSLGCQGRGTGSAVLPFATCVLTSSHANHPSGQQADGLCPAVPSTPSFPTTVGITYL